MPAAIREAAATYQSQQAFTLGLPNGSQGGLTFGEVDRLSDQFAVYLREVAGFKRGDRVALQMPNCLAYPVAVFGTLKAGLIMVNTNPLYTTSEMVHQFSDSGAAGLVVIDCSRRRSPRCWPDPDQNRRRRDHRGSAAAVQAHADQAGAKGRQEDGAADHVRAHQVRARAGAGRRWHRRRRGSALLSPKG